MKNSLIITEAFNLGPTGVVVKNIADGLFNNDYMPLIIAYNINTNVVKYQYFKLPFDEPFTKSRLFSQIEKAKLILFRSYKDYFTSEKDFKSFSESFADKIRQSNLEFVLVISSGNVPIRLLRLGEKLAKKHKVPFIVHATDPLPSPKPWGEKDIYRKAVLDAIRPFYKRANLICAANPVMLEYQLFELGLENKKSFVMYNPIVEWKALDPQKIVKNTFLYLGSIYGKRNPQLLISNFQDLLGKLPDARLIFVGSNINLDDYDIPSEKRQNFVCIDWTDHVEQYIEEAEVLIDYNANIEGDVFLSSKLSKYLAYNRKILVMYSTDSAPEKFLIDYSNIGIWGSKFSQNDFTAKAISSINDEVTDWSKRKSLFQTLSPKNQICNFLNFLFKQ